MTPGCWLAAWVRAGVLVSNPGLPLGSSPPLITATVPPTAATTSPVTMPEIISVFLVFSSTESSFGTHKERGTTLLAPRKLLELIRRNDRAGTTHCRHGLADLHAFSETEIWTNAEANVAGTRVAVERSEEHTSEPQSLIRHSYAVFCLKKKKKHIYNKSTT